jgi:hypothetical protein
MKYEHVCKVYSHHVPFLAQCNKRYMQIQTSLARPQTKYPLRVHEMVATKAVLLLLVLTQTCFASYSFKKGSISKPRSILHGTASKRSPAMLERLLSIDPAAQFKSFRKGTSRYPISCFYGRLTVVRCFIDLDTRLKHIPPAVKVTGLAALALGVCSM